MQRLSHSAFSSLQTLGVGMLGLCLTCPALHAGINRVNVLAVLRPKISFQFCGSTLSDIAGVSRPAFHGWPIEGPRCAPKQSHMVRRDHAHTPRQRSVIHTVYRVACVVVCRGVLPVIMCAALQAVLIGCANALTYRTRVGEH